MELSKIKRILAKISFVILTFSLLFVTANSKQTNQGVSIPYIPLPIIYIVVLFAVLFFIFILIDFLNNKIDYLQILLIIRILVLIFSTITNGHYNDIFGNLLLYLVPFFVYTLARENLNYNFISRLILFMHITIVIQVMLTFVIANVGYNMPYYKDFMVIPIAASNTIACLLVPMFIYIMNNNYSNNIKIFSIITTLIGVFLTKSRFGIIFLLIIYFIYFINYYRKIRKNDDQKSINICHTIILFSILFFTLLLTFKGAEIISKVINFLMGFAKGNITIDSLLTGRIELFRYYIDLFLEKPLLGNGLYYDANGMRPHNFVIQLLYENGIIGLLLFAAILLFIFKRIKNTNSKNCYVLIVILLQSLLEESLFLLPIDFIFWLIISYEINGGEQNV